MIGRNTSHYVLYRLGLSGPVTQTTDAERACLRRHASGKRTLVEIGVFHGVNTRSFRQVMRADGALCAVDPFPRGFFGLRGYGWARLIAHREVQRESNGRIIWVECEGKNAPDNPEVREVLPADFIFIDGGHSWEAVSGDWNAWRPHIEAGGIVALHDSRNCGGWGAEQFTSEVVAKDPRFRLVEAVDTLSVFRKAD
jgi:hypothetical protein